MAWDPSRYLTFTHHRLRPALDLIAQIPQNDIAQAADLGCGTGHITQMLAERWPDAAIVGVDSSAEMLARAPKNARITWEQADLARWTPRVALDLLFSNAALHWLDDHGTLFTRLLSLLAPGGILAVQMPHNHHAPSHTAMREAADAGPWADRVRAALRPSPVGDPSFYYACLADKTASIDLWETEYLHVLPPNEAEHPVVAWTRGTSLLPLIDAAGPDADAFLEAYAARIADAYPICSDGRVLFPFRRLFLIASAPK